MAGYGCTAMKTKVIFKLKLLEFKGMNLAIHPASHCANLPKYGVGKMDVDNY
jgi:hypothetical protein